MTDDELVQRAAELLGVELTPETDAAIRAAARAADEEITNVFRSGDMLYLFSAHSIRAGQVERLELLGEEWPDEIPG